MYHSNEFYVVKIYVHSKFWRAYPNIQCIVPARVACIHSILTVISVHLRSSSKFDNRFISCSRHHVLNLTLVTLVCRKYHGCYYIHKMFIVVSIRKSNSQGYPRFYATAFFQWLGCELFQVWPFHKAAWQWMFHSTLCQSKEIERTLSSCEFTLHWVVFWVIPQQYIVGYVLTCSVVCCKLSKGVLAPC